MALLPDLFPFINTQLGLPKGNFKFPGCLPVSIHREGILELYGHKLDSVGEYTVSQKADGTRYFLVFLESHGKNSCILIDRRGTITQLCVSMFDWVFQGTIFDVELTRISSDYLILIFDTICISGDSCRELYYPIRMELARMALSKLQILFPGPCRLRLSAPHPGRYPTDYNSVCIQLGGYEDSALYITTKDIYYPQALVFLHQNPGYSTDGFIWTSTTTHYMPFRTSYKAVLKWKPMSSITVDLLLLNKQIDFVRCHDLPSKYTSSVGTWSLYSKHKGDLVYISNINASVATVGVYECRWEGKWELVKYRKEKTHPNLLETVLQTLRNLEENLSSLDLLQCLDPYDCEVSRKSNSIRMKDLR